MENNILKASGENWKSPKQGDASEITLDSALDNNFPHCPWKSWKIFLRNMWKVFDLAKKDSSAYRAVSPMQNRAWSNSDKITEAC